MEEIENWWRTYSKGFILRVFNLIFDQSDSSNAWFYNRVFFPTTLAAQFTIVTG